MLVTSPIDNDIFAKFCRVIFLTGCTEARGPGPVVEASTGGRLASPWLSDSLLILTPAKEFNKEDWATSNADMIQNLNMYMYMSNQSSYQPPLRNSAFIGQKNVHGLFDQISTF